MTHKRQTDIHDAHELPDGTRGWIVEVTSLHRSILRSRSLVEIVFEPFDFSKDKTGREQYSIPFRYAHGSELELVPLQRLLHGVQARADVADTGFERSISLTIECSRDGSLTGYTYTAKVPKPRPTYYELPPMAT